MACVPQEAYGLLGIHSLFSAALQIGVGSVVTMIGLVVGVLAGVGDGVRSLSNATVAGCCHLGSSCLGTRCFSQIVVFFFLSAGTSWRGCRIHCVGRV